MDETQGAVGPEQPPEEEKKVDVKQAAVDLHQTIVGAQGNITSLIRRWKSRVGTGGSKVKANEAAELGMAVFQLIMAVEQARTLIHSEFFNQQVRNTITIEAVITALISKGILTIDDIKAGQVANEAEMRAKREEAKKEEESKAQEGQDGPATV